MSGKDSVIAPSAITDNSGPSQGGWALGLFGVLVFSFTLPANAWAVEGFDPVAITVWRALLPGLLAVVILWRMRAPIPDARTWFSLSVGGLCVGVGFPLLSSVALTTINPARAAVIMGLLPALTAVFATLLGKERPSPRFWLATVAGLVVLLAYLMTRRGAGELGLGTGDLAMFAATCCSALAYVLGADRAKVLGGPRSMCWTLVALLPLSVPAGIVTALVQDPQWTVRSTVGLLYLAVASTVIGYFAWYAGLARGGIARVGQVQQIQPILTICWSALFFADELDALTFVVGVVVALLVAVGQRVR
ncbi:Permease of the drug/metabolite transporter (DMT) superfamily [Streptoalloteichus tenebrarius]|uniref:Permease of the drug/metabolite transporter (DMT) superfamily n=1 Tax=Streptoalloteichus tenebrarius (strain ATCC 17920 / DSM 40477 / JCM 4838 / CBS 697.72 / NBRC 16177 / NCIMB 11028 / NRRL B-12390 / A12253. 1 / ISP 5477) TaxID=1933 RepID=A0ABT1HPQ4_STRSD|nr:DMT family transporter [Streptoalloteichus tenebrarius]MCP2257494.1 Permease of the drug/metabolite transporter (DMT) superfamily [Streptoalloteichus tenebrarius]BFE98443.1 DMT family transporter [Streptoalloteichus tenebrarius]